MPGQILVDEANSRCRSIVLFNSEKNPIRDPPNKTQKSKQYFTSNVNPIMSLDIDRLIKVEPRSHAISF